jgi:hypothetical protein
MNMLNKDHGGLAPAHEFEPIEGENGGEAGTVAAPKGQVLFGGPPPGQPGNAARLH